MTKTQEVKLMIIENFIDYTSSDEEENRSMKREAKMYVEEDWTDEINLSFNINR